jgi:hypothetical protein
MVTSIKITDQNTQVGTLIAKIVPDLTAQLIGESCQQVRFSYGDELWLDFGEMSPYSHPKLKDLRKGSWRFGVRATPWLLKQAEQIIVNSEIPESDEEILNAKKLVRQSLENKKILSLEINPHTLQLQLCFEKNYELILQPDLDDSDLAYWELFMPTQQILEIGPGYFWSCKSIHEKC